MNNNILVKKKDNTMLNIFICMCFIAFVVFELIYSIINESRKANESSYSQSIGASIWGGYTMDDNDIGLSLNFDKTNENTKIEENEQTGEVISILGQDNEFTRISTRLTPYLTSGKELTLYVFVKNIGDRYIIPTTSLFSNSQTSSYEIVETKKYTFDTSSPASIDPYKIKTSSNSMSYLNKIADNLNKGEEFLDNSSLDVNDVYLQVYTIQLQDSKQELVSNDLTLSVNFAPDIDYEADNVLTVYQQLNSSSSTWTKYGYNSTLNASATKIENSSLSSLALQLTNAGTNNVVTSVSDDYINTVVYKDIDLVNIDIATGEPIGKLSDLNYNFEWYGGRVTLPSGTRLASGRQLTTSETFTVDVYTYYPTFYIRRWVVGDYQYISVSDKYFAGSVKIDNFYTATFESTMFSPKYNEDGTVAKDANGSVAYEVSYNSNGIIPRSYVYDYTPITNGSVNHLLTYYLYENNSGLSATTSTTQANMLLWASNLTKAWESAGMTSASGYLPNATLAQGENYVAFIYNWLYLVKYANNNAQSQVGYGNTYTYSLYINSNNGVTITTSSGKTFLTVDKNEAGEVTNSSRVYYEAEKGGAVIGCYNSNDSYMNQAKMSYGYQYTSYTDNRSNNSISKKGLYANQFLVYNTGSKRVLLDGYVGSDRYTSVFCLGQCNAWGNVWTWVFGNVVNGMEVSPSTYTIQLYTSFEDYNYTTKNWYTSSSKSSYETLVTSPYNYTQMSYNLPTTAGTYNYFTGGNGLQSLIGVQTASSSAGGGLSDYYYVNTNLSLYATTYSFGLLRGGYASSTSSAGPFYFRVDYTFGHANSYFGFRLSLGV